MTAKQILEELQAEEELVKRGWRKVPCDVCGGSGVGTAPPVHGPLPPPEMIWSCWGCGGHRLIWVRPCTPKEPNFDELLMDMPKD